MPAPITGHLDYYTRHGINPVRYDLSDLQLHLDRRASLYRTLGVTPLAVRGARVLEVAPGTGQNSLYLARLAPSSLTLVEPNPVAIRDIASVYAMAAAAPVPPLVIEARFEDYEPDEPFDLVVCENWLGSSDHERRLLRKLGRMVAAGRPLARHGGLAGRHAAEPAPPSTGQQARRSGLAVRRTDVTVCRAFGPHLRTLAAMTRGVTDWVHDNMLNPAYFGILLTVPMVLAELAGGFDVLGSSPRFAADWRWFKGLCGTDREFNRHVLAEYRAGIHNFFDHRCVLPARDQARNAEFEAAALAVAQFGPAVGGGEAERRGRRGGGAARDGRDGRPARELVRRARRVPRRFRRPATHARDRCRYAALRSALRPRDDLPVVRETC